MRRFQLQLRGMLLATFWLCVGLAAWGLLMRKDWELDTPAHLFNAGCLVVVVYSAPFVAVCALFGKARLGVLFALPFAVLVWSLLAML